MLQIFTIPVTPFQQNARVLFDSEMQSAAIVDPGGNVERIWSMVEQIQPKQLSVLLTHAHIDHAGGTAATLERARRELWPDVKLFAHSEKFLRGTISRQAMVYGLPPDEYRDSPEPDVVLDEGDVFSLGNILGKVFWTPGHAPDHVSLFFDVEKAELHEGGRTFDVSAPVLIAGDALFAGSIGRTDLPGGDTSLLLRSIREKLLVLPEETIVLPGHGPPTTIGQEKRTNPYLQD